MSEDSQQGLTPALKQPGQLLETLLKKVTELRKLKDILDTYLDSKLCNKCSLANFENGHLAIITESAIWATQFRFQIPILQKKLITHVEFTSLREITCKVRPAISKKSKEKEIHPVAFLNAETARLIEDFAKNITDDKLREVMLKIASRTEE